MKLVLLVLSCLLLDVKSHNKSTPTHAERMRRKSIFSLRKGYNLENCPVNAGNESCWADSAKQKCVGLNMTSDEIYSKVRAAPDIKKMHEMYWRCAGATVIKSECTKGHKSIQDYEDVRHQCRHLLGSRPRYTI